MSGNVQVSGVLRTNLGSLTVGGGDTEGSMVGQLLAPSLSVNTSLGPITVEPFGPPGLLADVPLPVVLAGAALLLVGIGYVLGRP